MKHDYDPKDPDGWAAKESFQKLRDEFKIPLGCYACGKLMYNFDNASFYRYGVCQSCFISWIDERDLPEKLLTDRIALVAHIKEKIEEKKVFELNKVENE